MLKLCEILAYSLSNIEYLHYKTLQEMDDFSLLVQDEGYIKYLVLNSQNKSIQEKAKTTRAFADIVDIIKFNHYFLAIAKTHPEKPITNDLDRTSALLIFDQQLNWLETREFLWVETLANWRDEFLLLSTDDSFYVLDSNFNIVTKDPLMDNEYAKITSMFVLNEQNIGGLIEQNYHKSYIHQIVYDEGSFHIYTNVNPVSLENLNTQTIDLENKHWHVFGACNRSKNEINLQSCLLLSFPLDRNWEADFETSDEQGEDFYVFEKLQRITENPQNKNTILTHSDVITNKNLPSNYEKQSLDVIATTLTTPCWGIVRHNHNFYISKIDFDKENNITFSKFSLLPEEKSLSFSGQIVKFEKYLFITYASEFTQSDAYVLRVLSLDALEQCQELFKVKLKHSYKTFQRSNVSFDVFK